MTVQPKRTLKIEKLARIYDEEIAPVWGTRFGKMLLRDLAVPARGQVLDVSCGTGYPTVEILRRMSDGSRLIAIDASSAMLDVARRKIADLGPLGKKGVFFRTESAVPKLSFADDVYDLVVCNLGLTRDAEPRDRAARLRARRQARRRGALHAAARRHVPGVPRPLSRGPDQARQARGARSPRPPHRALSRPIEQRRALHAGAPASTARSRVEEFTLLFKSSREFFFAPVIEYGPLAEWKDIAGGGQEMQDVFWYIKEAIDAYFDGRPFQVTVKAGCLIGKKLKQRRDAAPRPTTLEMEICVTPSAIEHDDLDEER